MTNHKRHQLKQSLITIFSDASNKDLDFTKVLGGFVLFTFLVLSFYAYGYKESDWDPMNWTTAASILLGAIGGVSKIRDYTEKKDESTTTQG